MSTYVISTRYESSGCAGWLVGGLIGTPELGMIEQLFLMKRRGNPTDRDYHIMVSVSYA